MKIYHNPKCRKSRAGLNYLEEKNQDFFIVEYFKTPFTEKELENLLIKLNMKPEELIRTQEDYYKKNLKGKEFTDREWIKIMVENPQLIQRPIVEKSFKAVIADPPENIDNLLNSI